MTPNPYFKSAPLFNVEYFRNGTRYVDTLEYYVHYLRNGGKYRYDVRFPTTVYLRNWTPTINVT